MCVRLWGNAGVVIIVGWHGIKSKSRRSGGSGAIPCVRRQDFAPACSRLVATAEYGQRGCQNMIEAMFLDDSLLTQSIYVVLGLSTFPSALDAHASEETIKKASSNDLHVHMSDW
jgi:hypothetical protein